MPAHPGLFNFEAQLFQASPYKGGILGVDEVGRGALAGPIVGVCCCVHRDDEVHQDITDSKKLTPHKRRMLFRWIKRHHSVSLYAMTHGDIDTLGISHCNKEVLRRAVITHEHVSHCKPIIATLIDGNLPVKLPEACRPQTLVKGDSKSYAIACASIVAKHMRDVFMCRQASHFRRYGFEKHKGYGTSSHVEAIQLHGLSDIHRKSFCQGILLKQGLFF